MPRNAFNARFAFDASAARRRTPAPAARRRAGSAEVRSGRTQPPDRADAERPAGGAEPLPQADGHP